MELEELQKNFDVLGRTDPLWAIISRPEKKGNKWDEDEFFEHGKKEIREVMNCIQSLGITSRFEKAFDFGCGVGRLTQALADYFGEVHAVDIAPSMIEHAEKYNRFGDKCKYYINDKDNLELFPDNTFDLVYTNITLQHIEPRYSENYIKEFLRILVPSGLLIFQQPEQKKPEVQIDWALRLEEAKKRNVPLIEIHGIPREYLSRFLPDIGGKILDVRPVLNHNDNLWCYLQYFVTKEP